jgi:PAS domain S-box-containing protein
MSGATSAGKEADEVAALRERLGELEAQLLRHKQTSESRFYMLADAAPVMIWMSGSDSLCTYFNRAWLQFRGRRAADEVGHGWWDGVHPEDRNHVVEQYLKNFTARSAFRIEYRLQRADGFYNWVEQVGMPRHDESGLFCGYIGTAIDIHDRKRQVFTPDESAVRRVFGLTERERQVLILIASGRSTKEAAIQLGISYKTADSHRSRILEKLGIHETASMVRYAIRSGLIEP